MKKILAFISALFFILIFFSCSTDFNITAPYKATMVVYGLLNSNSTDSVQYIRIEKAFLGEGNSLIMAQQKDSINYGNVLDVKLERIQNGSIVQTYSLQRDTLIPKDDGLFYNPGQVLYKLNRNQIPIRPGYQYKL